MSLVKKCDLAKALNVDPSLITRWSRRGMPLYSVEAADIWRKQNIRPRYRPAAPAATARGLPADVAVPSFGSAMHDARLRRELAGAALAERALEELEGTLCRVADVRRASERVVSLIVRACDDMPSRLSPELAGQDHGVIFRRLKAWVHDFRETVAGQLQVPAAGDAAEAP